MWSPFPRTPNLIKNSRAVSKDSSISRAWDQPVCLYTPCKAATLSPPLKNSLRQAARTIPRRAIESNAFSLFCSNMSGFPYRRQLLELLITLFFTTSPLSYLWALLSPLFLPYVLRQAVRQSYASSSYRWAKSPNIEAQVFQIQWQLSLPTVLAPHSHCHGLWKDKPPAPEQSLTLGRLQSSGLRGVKKSLEELKKKKNRYFYYYLSDSGKERKFLR